MARACCARYLQATCWMLHGSRKNSLSPAWAAWHCHGQRGEQQRLPCPKRKTMDAGNSSRIQPVFCHGPKGVVLYPATGPYRHSPDAGNSSRVVGLLRGFPKGVK